MATIFLNIHLRVSAYYIRIIIGLHDEFRGSSNNNSFLRGHSITWQKSENSLFLKFCPVHSHLLPNSNLGSLAAFKERSFNCEFPHFPVTFASGRCLYLYQFLFFFLFFLHLIWNVLISIVESTLAKGSEPGFYETESAASSLMSALSFLYLFISAVLHLFFINLRCGLKKEEKRSCNWNNLSYYEINKIKKPPDVELNLVTLFVSFVFQHPQL